MPNTSTEIKIVITADGKAAIAEVQKLGDATKQLGDQGAGILSTLKQNWATLSIGINQAMEIFDKVIQIPAKMVAYAEIGATLLRTQVAFNAAAQSAGYFGLEVASALQKAADGTMTAAEVMNRGGRMMQEGLSPAMLTEAMNLLAKQAPLMGDTLSEAWDKYSLAVSTGSVRQLRAYVGMIDLQKQYDKYAESIGTVASMLTEEAKQKAVAEVITDRLREKQEGLTSSVSQQTESILRSKTEISQAWNEIYTAAVPLGDVLLKIAAGVMNFASGAKMTRAGLEEQMGGFSPTATQESMKGLDQMLRQADEAQVMAEKAVPQIRALTEEERHSIEQTTIASIDSWDTRLKIINEEYDWKMKMYGQDAQAATWLGEWKTNEEQKFAKSVELIRLALSEKYYAMIGDEMAALTVRYQAEIIQANGNATAIALINQRKSAEIIKGAAAEIITLAKADDDRLKQQMDFQDKLAQISVQRGAMSEEDLLRAKADNEVYLLEKTQQRLNLEASLATNDQARRAIVEQIQTIEAAIINARTLGEANVALLRFQNQQKIGVARQEMAASEMELRLANEKIMLDYQLKMGQITEPQAIQQRIQAERDVLVAQQAQLIVKVNQSTKEAEIFSLMNQVQLTQEKINALKGTEVNQIGVAAITQQTKILDLLDKEKQSRTQMYENSYASLAQIANLTGGPEAQWLGMMTTGMKGMTDITTQRDTLTKMMDDLRSNYTQRLVAAGALSTSEVNILRQQTRDEQNIRLQSLLAQNGMEQQSADFRTQIESTASMKKMTMYSAEINLVSGALGAVMSLMNNNNLAMFLLGKAIALAQAVIYAHLAAAAAYAAASPGGLAAAAAASASALMMGYAQVAVIAATTILGLASGSYAPSTGAVSGAGGGYATVTPTAPILQPQQQAKPPIVVNVNVYGNVIDQDKFARDFLPSIRKALSDNA